MRRRDVLTLPATLQALAVLPTEAAAATVLTRVETALGAFTIAVDPAVAPVTVAMAEPIAVHRVRRV